MVGVVAGVEVEVGVAVGVGVVVGVVVGVEVVVEAVVVEVVSALPAEEHAVNASSALTAISATRRMGRGAERAGDIAPSSRTVVMKV